LQRADRGTRAATQETSTDLAVRKPPGGVDPIRGDSPPTPGQGADRHRLITCAVETCLYRAVDDLSP